MLTPFSQAEIAFRDTLITKAEGFSLDLLGIMYGFPRLGIFERKYYRRALREVAFGKRGTYRTLFKVLESLFDQYSERRGVINVTLDPAKPSVLEYREGAAPRFDCASIQRFIRVTSPTFGSKVYYSQGVTAEGDLILNPIDTPAIAGANWSTLTSPEEGTAKIIGFMLLERNPGPPSVDGSDLNGDPWHPVSRVQRGSGELNEDLFVEGTFFADKTCTLELIIDNFIWSVPASYLQEDGTVDRTAIAPGQPFGGHLMSLFDAANRVLIEYPQSGVASEVHPESGDQEEGPFPIYLDAEGKIAGAFISLIDSILASGVHLSAEIKDWCEGLDEVVFNPFSPDFDLGNGGQGLPNNWDFERNGVPDLVSNREIEAAEHVNEYFIFEDAQGQSFFAEEKADLALSNTGKIILDSDTLYFLIGETAGATSTIDTVNSDGILSLNAFGKLNSSTNDTLANIPVATFVNAAGLDSSAALADAADNLKTETAGSGAPVIQLPGQDRTDNDEATPDTITRLLPRKLDLQGNGSSGYFQLKDTNGNIFWSQQVKIEVINGKLGIPQSNDGVSVLFEPAINIPVGANVIFVKPNGTVFVDVGQGVQIVGTLQVGVFPNPRGLFQTQMPDIYQETTAALQPIEHRRSGSPTVGALLATATRGILEINGSLDAGAVLLNGTGKLRMVKR